MLGRQSASQVSVDERCVAQSGHNGAMRISARSDYAVRATIEIAASAPNLVKADQIAAAQNIPIKFLENILSDLRRAGIVRSKRGAEGGYVLGFDPSDLSVAHVMRAVEGPLAWVRDERPGTVHYDGNADGLEHVWVAVRASLRSVIDHVTIADLVNHRLPEAVTRFTNDAQAWVD